MTTPMPECSVCGANGARIVAERSEVSSNVRAFARESFRVWRCGECQAIHAADEVDLARYYAQYPFFSLPFDWRLRICYAQQLHRLEAAHLKRSHRILDYGCGSGHFIEYLRSCGYPHAVGFDRYSPAYSDESALRASYDCVVSQDVLEHVAEPQLLLDEFHRLTRSGGIIAIGTPNASGIDLSRPEEYRHTLHAPYHRHIFSPAGLLASGKRRGWDLVRHYPTHYADTAIPFLNGRFYSFFMRTQDDSLDSLLAPPLLRPLFARLPEALYWGLCGAVDVEATDMMTVFRKGVSEERDGIRCMRR